MCCGCAAWLLLQVKPIIVADLLSTANSRASMADVTGMTAAVQGFLNNVVAAAGYGAAVETPEQLKQSVAAAMIGPRASMELQDGTPGVPAAAGPAAASAGGGAPADEGSVGGVAMGVGEVVSSDEEDEEDEKNTFHLAPATSSEVSSAAAATGSAGAGAAGTSAPAANGAAAAAGPSRPGLQADSSVASVSSSSSQPVRALGRSGSLSASGCMSQGRALLLKDAFLVFRALCKLSIRTSDSVTITDPTAVRGKVRLGPAQSLARIHSTQRCLCLPAHSASSGCTITSSVIDK